MDATGTIGQASNVIPLNSEINPSHQLETSNQGSLNINSLDSSPVEYLSDAQKTSATQETALQQKPAADFSGNFMQDLKNAITNFIQKLLNLFMSLFQSLGTGLSNQPAESNGTAPGQAVTNNSTPDPDSANAGNSQNVPVDETPGLNDSDSSSADVAKPDTGTEGQPLSGGSNTSIDDTPETSQNNNTSVDNQKNDTPVNHTDITSPTQSEPQQPVLPGQKGEIKAMTYNVLYNSHNGSPDGAADAVESLVRQNQPDLVSLQEVDDKSTYDAIAARMSAMDYGLVGNWRGSVQNGAGNMEFYKNSMFNKLGEDYFDSGIVNREWKRGAELATLEVTNGPNQGKTLLVGATHGPPDYGQDDFNQRLGDYIANHDNNVDGVIIGGDWNDNASDVAGGTGLNTQSDGSSPIDFHATKDMSTESVTPVGHNGSDHSAVVSTLDFE